MSHRARRHVLWRRSRQKRAAGRRRSRSAVLIPVESDALLCGGRLGAHAVSRLNAIHGHVLL